MDNSQQTSKDEPFADVGRVVVPRQRIARRIDELAGILTGWYEGQDLTVLLVLTGALTFTSDLVRKLPIRLRIEPVWVSSYPGLATRSREAKFRLPLPKNLHGQVLIVDDIYDSGQTMSILVEAAYVAGAQQVRTCSLLRKNRPDLPDRPAVDLFGFDVPDEFVVGYGLDFDGFYRNLPDVVVLRQHTRGGTS